MDRRQFLQTGLLVAGAMAFGTTKAYDSTTLITVERVMAWHPCPDYTREVIAPWFGDGKTPEETAQLPGIWEATNPLCNAKAMCWVLWHEGVFTEQELRLIFTRCLEALLPNTATNRQLIVGLRRFIAGRITKAQAKAALDKISINDGTYVTLNYFAPGIDLDDVRAYLWENKTTRLPYTAACIIALRPVSDCVRVLLGNLTSAQRTTCLTITGDVLGGRIDLSADLGV